MKFSLHHLCPHSSCNFSSSTPHDNFLTCDSSAQLKYKRLKTIKIAIHKLYTHTHPAELRVLIWEQIKFFYDNIPITQFNPDQIEKREITRCIHLQSRIGWKQLIRRRLAISYLPIIKRYYRQNKLRQEFTAPCWMSRTTFILFNLRIEDWLNYCSQIFTYYRSQKLHSNSRYTSKNHQ